MGYTCFRGDKEGYFHESKEVMAAVWEIKRAIRLLETAAFCTGTSGTQARSGGLIVIIAS